MKLFGLISAAGTLVSGKTIGTTSLTFDEDSIDFSELYGPLEVSPEAKMPLRKECCSTLKLWGDVALFTGRFDKTADEFDAFPIYKATRGELIMFFSSEVNRWVVSTNTDDFFVRALGGSTSCPDEEESWKVWDGKAFSDPDLVEPWAPYIHAPKMAECRPEDFEAYTLQTTLSSTFCSFIKSTGNSFERLCRDGDRIVQLAFGEWENSTNNFLDSNTYLTATHLETLDQWHSLLNSVILKRTWESDAMMVSTLRSYVKSVVNEVRSLYPNEEWAKMDERFLFLQ